ncbi:leucine-rich repeat domain-containing protein [Enterococcus wangshanyuanii]|uniref:Gram-positive cocci surface proteins LPxTG domain-containing protein n=2 Tax=Enterococcus wangshanyuanii TaxID=2005703 RepID=A0ABQ1PQU0_9ENTE|nr:LPXTG cell wall anchor domain-containing protein [Enterococcus wangshanyuanii]GGD01699.1 hypothetical protein GCM10011573_34050 [Enterococcus wangshanyuanii]
MKRTKILSYTTMITLLAPAIIGVHQAYADTVTSTTAETEEMLETTATTESSSMESTTETTLEQTEASSSEELTLDSVDTEIEEPMIDSSVQQDIQVPAVANAQLIGQTYADIFPDENLRKAIMEQLGATSEAETIEQYQIDKTSTIWIQDKNISNLEGIQVFQRLHDLNIYQNPISDISVLSQFPLLKYLRCGGTKITDFSALGGLKNLEWLELGRTAATSLESVANITSLKSLFFNDSPAINDLSPLENLVNLEVVSAQYCGVTDISPLGKLPNLKKYYVNAKIELPVRTPLNNVLTVPISDVQVIDIDGSVGVFENYVPNIDSGVSGPNWTDFSNDQFIWNNNYTDKANIIGDVVYLTYAAPSSDRFKKWFEVYYVIPYTDSSTTDPTEESSTDPSIPEEPTVETDSTTPETSTETTSSDQKPDKAVATPSSSTQSTETSTAGATKNLPETGTVNNGILAALGVGVLSMLAIWFGVKTKARK